MLHYSTVYRSHRPSTSMSISRIRKTFVSVPFVYIIRCSYQVTPPFSGENLLIRYQRVQYFNLIMKAGAVDTDHIQGKDKGCLSCRVSGSVTLLLVAAYFYFGCKHVKPVYYFGTPSMFKVIHQIAEKLPSFFFEFFFMQHTYFSELRRRESYS